MPRDGNGTMQVDNTFTPLTTISSTDMNSNFTDFADEMTNSLPRDGQAGMTGQLKAASGSVGAPGVAFTADPDTGIYRSASGEVAVANNGVLGVTFNQTGSGALLLADPTADQQAATKQFATKMLINTQTASYQLVAADAGKMVIMNVGSANNLTIPPNSTVPFPVGTIIGVKQKGTGQTSIVAGGGVTIESQGNRLKISAQYVIVALQKESTDLWSLVGQIST